MNTIHTTTEVTLDTKPVRTKNAKPVFCITDGKPYASCTDAALAEGVGIDCISLACRGKTKTANKKQWCFVKDMPTRILDISNAYNNIYEDAMKYRTAEAERKAKEAHAEAMSKLQEKMAKLSDELDMAKQMYEAMKAEYMM